MSNSHPVILGGWGGEVQRYKVLENRAFQPVLQELMMVHWSGDMYSYLGITIFHNYILNIFTALSTLL